MYSREEAKAIRQQFWTMFGKRYDRKWILYNTKIKDLVLKFSFEDRRAIVSIDIEHEDTFYKEYYYDKLVSLRAVLNEEMQDDMIYDSQYTLPSGKKISRIYTYLEGVKIQKQSDWIKVYEFYYTYMVRLEHFFEDYKEFIDD